LINRGPESLTVLRFVKKLGAITVLGNHECHLLAVAAGVVAHGKKDTLEPIINADDSIELLNWISQLPLIHHDDETGFIMVHAGLPPQWDLTQAMELASEVETMLTSANARNFLENMYGNKPDMWEENLSGWDRLRFIINAFTRMRYCNADGRLNFKDKGPPGSQSKDYFPWFCHNQRKSRSCKILFGHWASLPQNNPGDFHQYNVYPLDTGCVWGRKLTAMRIEDQRLFNVTSKQK